MKIYMASHHLMQSKVFSIFLCVKTEPSCRKHCKFKVMLRKVNRKLCVEYRYFEKCGFITAVQCRT